MTDCGGAAFRVAVIDVGSNSVRLMVADVRGADVRPFLRKTHTTRLAAGLTGNVLSAEAVSVTAQAIAGFAQEARDAGAKQIRAFGTSAMRDAVNRDELCAAAEKLAGVAIELMTGEQEARLAYLGAAPQGNRGVIDIGGGSTELICGRGGRVECAASVQMGAVRLMRMLPADVLPDRMLAAAHEAIAPHVDGFAATQPDRWIGVGGTITTLAAMSRGIPKYQSDAIEGYPLADREVREWLDRLCGMSLDERRSIVGLSPARAEIIQFGTAILLAAMRLLAVEHVYASEHDNLEGYIRRVFAQRDA